jgi:hypothetical protein
MKSYKYFCFIALSILLSCDEISMPIEDPEIPVSDRIVLIEELTGASCTNCPKGTAAIESIVKKFPGQVLVVGIHGELLSQPNAKSKFDFRNPKAKDLENWFRPWLGKPSATINRIYDEEDMTYMGANPELWQSAVENELLKPQEMNILLKSTYDAASRKVNLDVTAIPLVDLAGTHKITVYVLESDIIDAQSNGSIISEGYEFNHVLMDMMTPHDGEVLASNLVKETLYKKSYTYTIPTKTGLLDPKRMSIIVMVNKDEGKDHHVIQASEVHVIE